MDCKSHAFDHFQNLSKKGTTKDCGKYQPPWNCFFSSTHRAYPNAYIPRNLMTNVQSFSNLKIVHVHSDSQIFVTFVISSRDFKTNGHCFQRYSQIPFIDFSIRCLRMRKDSVLFGAYTIFQGAQNIEMSTPFLW